MYININGINTHYIQAGFENNNNSENILILHGWGCNVTVYDNIIKQLSQKYKVTALDLPGFGQTSEPKRAFSVDDFADFVLNFLAKLNIDSLMLFGHSLGGRIAIKLCARKDLPVTVTNLILTGSAGIKPKKTVKQRIKQRMFKVAKSILNTKIARKISPSAIENMKKNAGSADYRSATPIMRESLVKIVNEDLTPLLPSVKSPSTLLIWGENDDAAPLADGQLMEQQIPEAGLAVIKNAGHYAFLEQPYVFASILNAYLKLGE